MDLKITVQIPNWKKDIFKFRKNFAKKADFFFTGKTPAQQRQEFFCKQRLLKENEKIDELLFHYPTINKITKILKLISWTSLLTLLVISIGYGVMVYNNEDKLNSIPDNIWMLVLYGVIGGFFIPALILTIISDWIPRFFARNYHKKIIFYYKKIEKFIKITKC